MKRKIFGIVVFIVLVVSILTPTVFSYDDNGGKDRGVDTANKFLNLENDPNDEYSWCEYPLIRDYQPATDPEERSPKPALVDTPSEFSWIDYNGEDWTSPISDQGACGSCWLFAAIGCLECIINVREECPNLDVDLSEQYVLSCLSQAGSCRGGIASKAFRYIMSNSSMWGNGVNGIIPESCFKYHGIDKRGWDYYQGDHRPVLCEYKCDNWEEMLIPISDYGYYDVEGTSEDIAIIKSQVYSFGPVVTSIAVSRNFGRFWGTNHSPDDYYPYEEHDDINHNVIIVGWKDDPSIPNGGFWRIKNTWGTNGGYNGFFNIEYGSLHIDDAQIQWVDYDPDNYTFKPIVKSGGPYYANIGEEIIFDASNSFAPESNITSYEWDFGDGTTDSGETVYHSYSSSGVFKVTLTVEDDIGNVVKDETAAIIKLWEVGDSWTYKIDEISLSVTGGLNVSFDGSIDNLIFEVSDITDDYYIFDFEGEFKGKIYYRVFKLFTDKFLNPGLYFSRGGKISGQISLNKSNYRMDKINITVDGKIMPIIGSIPIPIPLPYQITINNEFYKGFIILDFPIEVGKKWDLPIPRAEVDMLIDIESNGLNIINIINKLSNAIGLNLIPDHIYTRIVGRPNTFTCTNEEQVVTNSGTYNTYRISLGIFDDEFLTFNYAPEVGGIVKIHGNTDDFQLVNDIIALKLDGELISTNYEG